MILLTALALAQSAFAETPSAAYAGECVYPPGLGEPEPLEARALCDRVVTDADGVEFRDSNWPDRRLRFSGEWLGERLTVRTVIPRNGETFEARGQCRIYRANDRPSMVACTAVSGGRSWIGNFRIVRPVG